MTLPHKSGPPRLFSWISNWTRRSSSSISDDGNSTTAPPPPPQQHVNTTPARPVPPRRTCSSYYNDTEDDYDLKAPCSLPLPPPSLVEPINVPRGRPSITLSVAGTPDTLCSSSWRSSIAADADDDDDDEELSTSSGGRRNRNSLVLTELYHKSVGQHQRQEEDGSEDVYNRLGSSFPEISDASSARRRPASAFSLPPPSSRLSWEQSGQIQVQIHACRRPKPSAKVKSSSNESFCCKDDWPRADRMIVRQELVRLAMDGSLFSSPLDIKDSSQKRRILHVGCGDGAWCIEMATAYKHCWVLGIDDRNMVSARRSLPRNFRFYRARRDILHDLRNLPDNQFDLIYCRFLIFSYPPDIYREIIQECWRLCRPNGFVEAVELDMHIFGNPVIGPTTQMLNEQVLELMKKRGLDPDFVQHLQDLFFFHELVQQMHQQHGDAYHAKFKSLPLGLWGGRMGVMFRDDLHELVASIHSGEKQQQSRLRRLFASLFVNGRDNNDEDDDDDSDYYDPWTNRRFKAILERVDEELETHYAFMNLYCVYAHKLQ